MLITAGQAACYQLIAKQVKRHKPHARAAFHTTDTTDTANTAVTASHARQRIADNRFTEYGTVNHREFFPNQAGGNDTPAILDSGAARCPEPGAAGGALDDGHRGVKRVFLSRAVDVRLQVDGLRDGDGRAYSLLRRVDARRQVDRRQLGGHADLGRDQEVVRADVRRPQVDQVEPLRSSLNRGHDPRRRLLRGRVADQQALRLVPDDEGGAGEQHADTDRADAVPLLVPGQLGEQHAEEGEAQPDQ